MRRQLQFRPAGLEVDEDAITRGGCHSLTFREDRMGCKRTSAPKAVNIFMAFMAITGSARRHCGSAGASWPGPRSFELCLAARYIYLRPPTAREGRLMNGYQNSAGIKTGRTRENSAFPKSEGNSL